MDSDDSRTVARLATAIHLLLGQEEPARLVAWMQHQEELSGHPYAALPVPLHHRLYIPDDSVDAAIYDSVEDYVKDVVALTAFSGSPHPVVFHALDDSEVWWKERVSAWTLASPGNALFEDCGYKAVYDIHYIRNILDI